MLTLVGFSKVRRKCLLTECDVTNGVKCELTNRCITCEFRFYFFKFNWSFGYFIWRIPGRIFPITRHIFPNFNKLKEMPIVYVQCIFAYWSSFQNVSDLLWLFRSCRWTQDVNNFPMKDSIVIRFNFTSSYTLVYEWKSNVDYSST